MSPLPAITQQKGTDLNPIRPQIIALVVKRRRVALLMLVAR
jgi:hypothetical protein